MDPHFFKKKQNKQTKKKKNYKKPKMATQIMSILRGKYITYVKLINPEDALHGQKFHFLKNLIYTDVRFGTVLSINISSFNNNFSQMSVLYLQTNVPVTSYIYPYILGN